MDECALQRQRLSLEFQNSRKVFLALGDETRQQILIALLEHEKIGMDYRIEKKDAFQLICKKKQVTKPQGDTATADISAFWNEVSADGTMRSTQMPVATESMISSTRCASVLARSVSRSCR